VSILTSNQPAKAVPWQTRTGFHHFDPDGGSIALIAKK
jgi:hypothetical protein